ncbi:Hydrolethalus syndrome protein 1 [Schistosoma japonicum]|uniref:Hydrolethalus syndrome protein 1 n=1 Tax=Schistosoma japonicum TaxID=6182 RepID=A0A4Z2CTV2_SCHJA|nr:Hydrolethalus syndrome protein 1 [Schistosoma japonicum]
MTFNYASQPPSSSQNSSSTTTSLRHQNIFLNDEDLNFSFDEIRRELSNLGVTDLNNEQLIRLKHDLDLLISKEKIYSPHHLIQSQQLLQNDNTSMNQAHRPVNDKNFKISNHVSTVTHDNNRIVSYPPKSLPVSCSTPSPSPSLSSSRFSLTPEVFSNYKIKDNECVSMHNQLRTNPSKKSTDHKISDDQMDKGFTESTIRRNYSLDDSLMSNVAQSSVGRHSEQDPYLHEKKYPSTDLQITVGHPSTIDGKAKNLDTSLMSLPSSTKLPLNEAENHFENTQQKLKHNHHQSNQQSQTGTKISDKIKFVNSNHLIPTSKDLSCELGMSSKCHQHHELRDHYHQHYHAYHEDRKKLQDHYEPLAHKFNAHITTNMNGKVLSTNKMNESQYACHRNNLSLSNKLEKNIDYDKIDDFSSSNHHRKSPTTNSSRRSARFLDDPVEQVHSLPQRPNSAQYCQKGDDSRYNVRSPHPQNLQRSVSSNTHKRHDPVTRYHSYQRSWSIHSTPGENARRVLRWNIKAAMMHKEIPLLQRNSAEVARLLGPYALAYLERERHRRIKALQLDYIPPTSRRYDDLRQSIRSLLANSS